MSVVLGILSKRSSSWRTVCGGDHAPVSNVATRGMQTCWLHIPSLAVFALAKEDNTVLLVVIRSTRPWEFLVI